MSKKQVTIPSYSFDDTSNPNIKRFVDRKGDWTHYWNVKQKRFKPAVNHVLGIGYNKGPRFYQYLLSVTEAEAKQRLQSAGEEGTRTHQAIRQIIDGLRVTMTTKFFDERTNRQEVLNDDEWDNIEAFMAFYGDFRPETIEQEFVVDSDAGERGYAGTADYACTLLVPDGVKCASGSNNPFPKQLWGQRVLMLPIDWKTSASVWFEYEAQVAAYWYAILENGLFRKFTNAFKGRTFTGVVRLGTSHKNGYEFKIWNDRQLKKNFGRFMAAYEIYQREEDSFEPEVRAIPTEFYLKVPTATAPKNGKPKKQTQSKTKTKGSPEKKARDKVKLSKSKRK